MNYIPFNFYNHFLVNARFHVFNLEQNFNLRFSFYEYIRSQMHYPLVVYLSDRNPEDYKKIYLDLKSFSVPEEEDFEIYYRVIRYFYKDIYSSLSNMGSTGEFSLDLECLSFLGLPYEEFTGDFTEKLIKLNKSATNRDLILWR